MLTFFLATVRPDGRPHAAGVGAVWFDDDLYRFTVRSAVGVATAEPNGATRWTFDPVR